MNKFVTRRAFVTAGLSTAAGASGIGAAVYLAGRYGLIPPHHSCVLGIGETLTYSTQRLLTSGHLLAREFKRSDISKIAPVNGPHPTDENYLGLLANGFSSWRLSVEGLVERPVTLSLEELKRLPAESHITLHACEEGWSYIAEWTGVRLASVLNLVETRPGARYVVFEPFANPSQSTGVVRVLGSSIDMADAVHPQTLAGSRFVFALVAVLLIGMCSVGVTRLSAQSATATILGTVTDASGAAVPDAAIQVKNVATGITQSATSDAQGRFRLPELGVGDYEVQASKMGFQTSVHKGMTLAVGSQTVVDFALQVGQQQQTVTIEGEVAQVETTNASIGVYTSEQQMRELPLNGRNFEQLIQLAPGVTTATWSTNPLQGRGDQYSVAGGRPEGQAILLDDENLQSYFNNGMSSVTGSSLGVEAIGEFQTLTNAYGAQFGGNGAVINAVTKSGTNSFHGSAFDFLRNSALDDRNFFSPSSSPPAYRRNQFGGSVGGPVKKDKAFFFVDYEGIRSLFEEEKVATVPNCAAGFATGTCAITATNPATAMAIANTLAIYPKPTSLIGGGLGLAPTSGSQIDHEDYTLGRFDYTFSEKDSMFVRYYSDNVSYFEPYGGAGVAIGGGALPYWNEQDGGLSQYAVLEERHIFSPTIVNVVRMSFSRPTKHSNETSIITAADGSHPLQFFNTPGLEDGFVSIAGIPGGLGGATAEIFTLNQNTYTWADDILWTRGAHSFRFGASVDRQQSNTYNPISEDGSWSFGSLSAFLAGAAISVGGVPPKPSNDAHRDYLETLFTPYIYDDSKVTPKLTVNLGLRYEFYTNPIEAHNRIFAVTNILMSTAFVNVPNAFKENISFKDWDPRVGIAYDPFADHKTSIRAGFGMFHTPVTGLDYQTGYGNTPPWQSLTQAPATYPFAFTTVNAVIPRRAGAVTI